MGKATPRDAGCAERKLPGGERSLHERREMKRVGHLFERVVDPENLRLAFIKASRGKRHREDQQTRQEDLDREIVRLREGLVDLDYPIGNYRRFTIYEPKEREICAASFGERVLHHVLMNVCEPYFDTCFIARTCNCICA